MSTPKTIELIVISCLLRDGKIFVSKTRKQFRTTPKYIIEQIEIIGEEKFIDSQFRYKKNKTNEISDCKISFHNDKLEIRVNCFSEVDSFYENLELCLNKLNDKFVKIYDNVNSNFKNVYQQHQELLVKISRNKI